jgi:hypothetical protein
MHNTQSLSFLCLKDGTITVDIYLPIYIYLVGGAQGVEVLVANNQLMGGWGAH